MELAALVSAAAPAAGTAGAAAAGTAAAGTAAAGAAAAGSGFFSLSTLSTGLSLASMVSELFGAQQSGEAQYRQLTQQAQENLIQAKQEELKGKQESNDIMDQMLQTIAAQRLAFSSAGIDPSFGTPVSLAENARNLAERQLGTSRDNARLQVLARRRSADNRIIEAGSAQSSATLKGLSGAGGTLATLIDRRLQRG